MSAFKKRGGEVLMGPKNYVWENLPINLPMDWN